MQTYTEYQERIRKSFAAAYNFLDTHKHPRTSEDWERITKDTSQYTDPLTVDLIAAAVSELEREYLQSKKDSDNHI
jgi:hypothetical protein